MMEKYKRKSKCHDSKKKCYPQYYDRCTNCTGNYVDSLGNCNNKSDCILLNSDGVLAYGNKKIVNINLNYTFNNNSETIYSHSINLISLYYLPQSKNNVTFTNTVFIDAYDNANNIINTTIGKITIYNSVLTFYNSPFFANIKYVICGQISYVT